MSSKNRKENKHLVFYIASALLPCDIARQVLRGRGGSRISGKEVQMYKGVGVCFDFISFFLNIP